MFARSLLFSRLRTAQTVGRLSPALLSSASAIAFNPSIASALRFSSHDHHHGTSKVPWEHEDWRPRRGVELDRYYQDADQEYYITNDPAKWKDNFKEIEERAELRHRMGLTIEHEPGARPVTSIFIFIFGNIILWSLAFLLDYLLDDWRYTKPVLPPYQRPENHPVERLDKILTQRLEE